MPNLVDGFDDQLHALLVRMAETGIHNAARGISSMIGENVTVADPGLRLVHLAEIPHLLGGPETEAVGIYLRAEGSLSGQFMLLVPTQQALRLVDLVMDLPSGATTRLGSLERSALAELGNLTGTFFLNAVASSTGLDSRPTPPAVLVDMVGAIMDILVSSWVGLSEHVLMIQATFTRGDREIEAAFWVIPDRSTLEAIRQDGFGRNA